MEREVPPHQGVALASQAASREGRRRPGLRGLADRFRSWTTADAFADDRAQIPLLADRVRPLLPGPRLLEIGAGEQYYRDVLAPLGDLITMDVSWYGPTDLLGDAHAIPFLDGSLDAICVVEVLEHLARPWVFFQEASRVLRPGGILFGVTPQYCPTHGYPHDYFRYTRGGLDSLASSSGLRLLDAWPLGGSWATLLRWYWANHARESQLRRVPGLNLAHHAWFQSLVALSDRLDHRDHRGSIPSGREHDDHLGWSFVIQRPADGSTGELSWMGWGGNY
jgi:SAM-dependent methyltransferase